MEKHVYVVVKTNKYLTADDPVAVFADKDSASNYVKEKNKRARYCTYFRRKVLFVPKT